MVKIISSSFKKKVELPESFNELTAKQLLNILAIREITGNFLSKQLRILRVLLNMKPIKFALLNSDLKTKLLPFTEVFLTAGENNLTKNIFYKHQYLYGPKDRLLNLRMAEFHAAEIHYKRMLDGLESAVDDLIAVLYRTPKKNYGIKIDEDGDIRLPYNGHTVPHRARLIANWNRHVKQAIVMFYDGCRQQIIKLHPVVFTNNQEKELNNEQQLQGMFLMMRGLAADGKYGDMDKIEELYVYTALNELTQLLLEQKELEAKMNN